MMSSNMFGTWKGQGVLGGSCSFTEKKMKGKARIHFRRMLELSDEERSWKEILVHEYGDDRSEMTIKYSK